MGWPHRGGLEAVVAGLAEALHRRGHAVRVITLDRSMVDDQVLPTGRWRGVPYERLTRVGPRRYPFARGLVDAVRGADLVHVHGLDGLADQLVASRRWHGAKVGISTQGGYFHTPRMARVKSLWFRTITRWTLSCADAIWYASDLDRQRLEAVGVQGTLLLDGVDVTDFARLKRAPEAGYWVVPGRVDVHKGHADLIATLGRLAREDRRPFRVEVVGPEARPGLVQTLKEAATQAGIGDRVHFRGEVADEALRDALARCEWALFPSRYEGFGVGVVEAMAAGVPVVTSRIVPFQRLVEHGVSGWSVEFGDPASAARRLGTLRDTDLAHVGNQARVAASEHAWSRRVLEVEEAYRAMLGRAP